MKRLLLIITSILFFTTLIFLQSKVNKNNLVQYGDKWFKENDDKPYTGRVFDLYKSNGSKKLEGQYKDGLMNGKWIRWYENGNKSDEGSYFNGDGTDKGKTGIPRNGRDGKWTIWYQNGQKMIEMTYKDGERDGLWTRWYENGQKKSEIHYKDGEQQGLHTSWYENGQKEIEETFKDGYVISKKFWNKDGSVKE